LDGVYRIDDVAIDRGIFEFRRIQFNIILDRRMWGWYIRNKCENKCSTCIRTYLQIWSILL